MKIYVLSDYYYPQRGGFARYTYEITKNWILNGVDVRIFTSISLKEGDAYPDDGVGKKIKVFKKRGGGYLGSLLIFLRFAAYLIRNNPDYIFLPTWYRYSMPMVIFHFITFKRYKYAIGCHAADILGLYKRSSLNTPKFLKRLGLLAIRNANILFSISNYTAKELRRLKISSDKIFVVPNGVDYKKFQKLDVNRQKLLEKYDIKNDTYIILLTVARLNPRKGMDVGVEVVRQLLIADYNVLYIIIGKGEDQVRLDDLIKMNGLENNVYILNNVNDNDLLSFYNACDIFMLLSRKIGDLNIEGFGLVLLEASACGKAVIGGNSGGIPDAIVDKKSGYLVNPENVYEISTKIKELIDNPELRIEVGKYGRKMVIDKYSWKRTASTMIKYMEIYK